MSARISCPPWVSDLIVGVGGLVPNDLRAAARSVLIRSGCRSARLVVRAGGLEIHMQGILAAPVVVYLRPDGGHHISTDQIGDSVGWRTQRIVDQSRFLLWGGP